VSIAKRASWLNRPKPENPGQPSPERPKLFLCPPKPEAPPPSTIERYSRQSVDWYAGRIEDPVARLKFLRHAAPKLAMTTFRIPWRMVGLVLSLGAIASVSAFFLLQQQKPLQPVLVPIPAAAPAAVTAAASVTAPADVWQVEKNSGSEVYSNGLRIDNHFLVSNHPRSYLAFPVDGADQSEGVHRSEPVGIVFHTTESRQAPFVADQNRVLKKIGESLLEYVRRKRAYHFLIDRFGRVYRVVAETDAANHAGNSIWADDQWLYINLNQSFLGVSIEATTADAEMSPAQLRAAAMLTEMLRSRYHIAAANCVTHAQVSVNPSNMQVGYHDDWASSFPFEQLGLPDNYQRALPALWASGFEYNRQFQRRAGDRISAGIQLAEDRLAARAAQAGLSVGAYRRLLQKRYRKQLEAVRKANADESDDSE
jgi:hypothetical protein